VFYDDWGVLIEDEHETDQEPRFVLIGTSAAFESAGGEPLLPGERRGDSSDLGEEGEPSGAPRLRNEMEAMKKNYDFSKRKKNPYARRF
jgi:hypothetical protein